jgi:hypothetical protein
MQTVCNIAVDIIDEDTVIGDSWATINKNFELLDEISCSVFNKVTTIPTNLNSINSLSGINGVNVTPSKGIVTVSQTYCEPWHVGKTKSPLYAELSGNRMSLQIANSNKYLEYVNYVIAQNPPLPGNETVEARPTGIAFTGDRHCDVVTLGDGRVFFVPYTFPNGVIYDPTTDKFNVTSYTIGTGFASGCLLPDGRVCMIPGTSNKIYFWSPQTGSVTISNVNLSEPGLVQPYNGGVLLADGKIMLIPFEKNDGTVVYDPVTDTVQRITDTLFTSVNGKSFYSGQLLYDGTMVVLTPYNSTYSIRIETDYPYNVYTANALGAPFPGNGAYSGTVLLPDGRVYFIPYNATTAKIFDPVTDSFTTPNGIFPGNDSYRSGFLLPDGRVCMPPFGAGKIAFYDPVANTTLFSSNVGGFAFKYSSGTVLEDGSVIIAPYTEPTALFLNIGTQTSFSRAMVTGPLFSGNL